MRRGGSSPTTWRATFGRVSAEVEALAAARADAAMAEPLEEEAKPGGAAGSAGGGGGGGVARGRKGKGGSSKKK